MNRPVAGFTELREDARTDVRIHVSPANLKPRPTVADEPWYVSKTLDASGRPLLRILIHTGGGFCLEFADGTGFFVNKEGREVMAFPSPDDSGHDVMEYLVGPIVAFLWLLRGVPCLHASAVVVENRAIIFVGPSNSGKSTVAAECAIRGFPVIADDLIPCYQAPGKSPHWTVFPGDSLLRLRTSAVEGLKIPSNMAADLLATRDPDWIHLNLSGSRFQETPLPLGEIYLCGGVSRNREQPIIEPVRSGEALVILAANSWAHNVLDRKMRSTELVCLARLAATLPVRRVFYRRDASSPRQLVDAITVPSVPLH